MSARLESNFPLPINTKLVSLVGALLCLCTLSMSASAQELFSIPSASPSARGPQQDSGKLKLLPLLHQYRGEETRGVRYFNVQEQARHRVIIRAGRLWTPQGQPLNAQAKRPKVSPDHAPVPPPPPAQARALGYAIYVMDKEGTLYVSFESEKDKVHHSSLLAGAPVACAGELLVFQGELLLINNQSGHYRPPPQALQQAITVLKGAGLDLTKVKVKTFGVDL